MATNDVADVYHSVGGWYVHPGDAHTYRCVRLHELVELLDHEYGDEAQSVAARIAAVWRATNVVELDALDPSIVERYIGYHACHSAWLDEVKRWEIDRLTKTYGIEYAGKTAQGAEVSYCNAGDSYAATILFVGGELRVGDWGSMVEQRRIKGYDHFTGRYAYA